MVQSAAIKQGRLANCKHTYFFFFFFFFGLSGSYNKSSQIKVSHLFNTGGRVALYRPTIFNNDRGLRQTANLQCA